MASKNRINSNFQQIAIADTNGNIEGLQVSGDITANTYYGDGSHLSNVVAVSAEQANIANVAYSVDGANVVGQVADAAHADIADAANVAYSVDGANVVGQVANALVADSALSVAGANVVGDVAGADHANIADVANLAYALQSDVANVSITGGSAGQFLQTDGSGILAWASVDATSIQNGGTNVSIPVADGGIELWVAGAWVGNINGDESNLTSNFAVAGDLSAGNISTVGGISGFDINVTDLYVNGGMAQLGDVSAVKITGGNSGEYLQTDGTGNLAWSAINSTEITNGTSNVSIPSPNGAVEVNVNGVANVALFSDVSISLTVPLSTSSSITIDEGLGLGNIVIDPVLVTQLFDNTVGGTLEIAPTYIAINDGASTAVNAGQITLLDALSNPAIPTQPEQVTTKQYVDDAIANTANANYANFAGDVVNAAQPNITSLGNLTGLTVAGDALITGNLSVQGNLTYIDVTDLRIQDPVIQLGGGANGAPLTSNDGKDRGTQLQVYDTGAGAEVDKFMGWKDSAGEFVFGSNITNSNDVITVNAYGNVRADTFIGDLEGTAANASLAYALDADVANVSITGGSNAQVLTTDGAGNLSWTTPTVFTPLKYTKEFHVDTYNGNDTTGNGSYEKPYKTIMKAHSVMDGSGQALYIHAGVYSEAVTWTRVNADIIGVNDGGISYLQGAWTVSPASSSVRIRNVQWGTTASLTHNTAGSLYLTECTFSPVAFNKTGTGYVQLQDCDLGSASAVSVTGSGTFLVNGGMISNITLNNASALVSLVGCLTARAITVTAGIFSSKGSVIYSTGATANAITAAAGTTVYLFETAVYTPASLPARLSLAGNWSINSSQYDRTNSTLTGTNIGTITYWDAINVRGVSTLGAVGNVRITGGTSGQYLQTDGAGNLSFATVDVANATVANANYSNFAGEAFSVSGSNVSGEVANAAYATNAGTAYALDADVSNVIIAGGLNGQVLSTNGSGNLAWTTVSTVPQSNADWITLVNKDIGDPVYPSVGAFAGTVRTASTQAELVSAIAASTAGDVIQLTADITLTSTLTIDKAIKLTSDVDGTQRTLQSAGATTDPVTLVSITAAAYLDSNIIVWHRKTSNTSVETAVSVNTTGFVSEATVKFMEFGYVMRGSFRIGGQTIYTGALGNNHRHIAIYNLSAPSIIQDVEYDFPQEATARASFIYVSSNNAVTERFESILRVSNTRQSDMSKTQRQFFLGDSWNVTGRNASLYFDNNAFNDVNGGIGIYSAAATAPLDVFTAVVLYNNIQGTAGDASYKGLVFIDGTGSIREVGVPTILAIANNQSPQVLRSDYSWSITGDIAFKNTTFTSNVTPVITFGDDTATRVLSTLTVRGVSTLGAVGNVKITGGTSGQYLQTDGAGNLTFATVDVANATVANANYSNFAGTAFSVDGSNVVGTVANATYAVSSDTANSATVAASANSVAVANVVGIGNIATINLDGNVANVLAGDGTWIPASEPATEQPMIEFTANAAGGAGQSFTDANLVSFSSNTQALVFVNGVLQRVADYTISGDTLTFTGYLASNDLINVGALSGFKGDAGPAGSNAVSSGSVGEVQYAAAGNTFGSVSNVAVSGTRIVSDSVITRRNAAVSTTLDCATGDVFQRTITGATTLSVANAAPAGQVSSFVLELTNPGTNVTWWSGIRWANATPPTLSTTGTDVLGFYTTNGGTNWTGFMLAKAVA